MNPANLKYAIAANKRNELKQLIISNALMYGDFTLASGAKSTYYLDCRRITLSAIGARLIGQIVWDEIAALNPDAIGGLSIGADPIVGAVLAMTDKSDLAGFIVRKEAKQHGTGKCVEGPINGDMNVVIIEDITTTGQSAKQAVDKLEKIGCNILAVVSLVDRMQGADEFFEQLDIPFWPIFTIENLGIRV